MITRDKNRASVIIWSMANETPVSADRTDFLKRMIKTTRELDPVHLVSAALERRTKEGSANTQVIDDPLQEYQEELFKESVKMLDKIPQLRGMTPWILADFRSPRCLLPDIQDGWNRKGLISQTGNKKKAFFVLQDYYKTKKSQFDK